MLQSKIYTRQLLKAAMHSVPTLTIYGPQGSQAEASCACSAKQQQVQEEVVKKAKSYVAIDVYGRYIGATIIIVQNRQSCRI